MKDREKKNTDRTDSNSPSAGKFHITFISYLFMIMFGGLFVFIVYFAFKDNSSILNNPYNKIDEHMQERVIRGSILTADNQIIAQTEIDGNGSEKRKYPQDNLFSHIVGYYDKGKTGLEDKYNYYLVNCNANFITQAINEIRGKKSRADSLVTTLDSKLQQCAYDALGNHKGAVIAMEPETGAVLAMVSKPDYNPNTIKSDWDRLVKDEDNSPLLNRAVFGLYPPGSTFKLVTLIEYLKENKTKDYSFNCKGSYKKDGFRINCHNKKAHGEESLVQAFANSCNSAFSDIGLSLDIKAFRKTCRELLFNKEITSDIPCKGSKFSLKANQGTAMIMQTSIGQGNTLITPLHNAILISACANGGYAVKPYIADKMVNSNNITVKEISSVQKERIIDDALLPDIKECLKAVTTEGTATAFSGQSYDVYGKTGTAEYNSAKQSHAWFIGYADYNGKKLAVSIIVESAGTGSDYAVPIAKKLFDVYY